MKIISPVFMSAGNYILRNSRAALKMILFFGLSFGFYARFLIGSFFYRRPAYRQKEIFGKIARIFTRISGMRVEVRGKPPGPPFLLVSNHLGYVDIAALRSVSETVFVAKSDVRNWFLAGKIISDMGTVFTDRNNRRDILRTQSAITEKLQTGESVTFFPEGTSTNGKAVLKFNSSLLDFAAKKNLPVYYAAISYKTDPDMLRASKAICWWDETVFIEHLWRLFGLKTFTAILNFGEQPVTNSNRKELARQLYEAVNRSFIPLD